ncbi:MAG: tetratricopeptide repeat protein [Acidobacteriota bacterium]
MAGVVRRFIVSFLTIVVWIVAPSSPGATGAIAAVPSGQDSDAGSLFVQVRRAVTSGDDERLYDLARTDPWGFREVVNHLGDLVVEQGGRQAAADAFVSAFVAGHLAAIHLQATGDHSLADRLRRILDWSGRDMARRAEVDDLLSRVESPAPPLPRDLEKAAHVCERLSDQRCLGLVRAGIGRLHERAGRSAMAILWYERAVPAFRQAGEMGRLRNALLSSGQLLLSAGQAGDAARSLGAAATISAEIGDPGGQAATLVILGEALGARGSRDRALAALTEARRIAIDHQLPGVAADAILLRATLRDEKGALPASAEDYLAAARLAQQAGNLGTVVKALMRGGTILLHAGETGRAAETIDRGLSAARLGHLDADVLALLLLGAELDAQLDDFDRAIRRLQEALELVRGSGEPAREARVLELFGTTLLEAGRLDAAVGPLEEARDMAHEIDATAVEGRAEGGLGAVTLARGDLPAAREHYSRSAELLEKAGDRFQALHMRRILETIETRPAPPADS